MAEYTGSQPSGDPVARYYGQRTGAEPRHEFTGAEYVGADECCGAEYVGADPSDALELTIHQEKTANGWRTTVRVPLVGLEKAKALFVYREHKEPKKAAKSAVQKAASVLDSPAVAALIPPQAKFALNIVRSGKARDIAKKLLSLF
jgi:hypothetical protein